MANRRIAQNLLNLLNLGSKEEVMKPVKRVRELADLEQTTSKQTSLDPAAGRVTSSTGPPGALTPSGHYVSNTDEGILGECVSCREDYEEDGTPELVTLVPKAEGGGGVCRGCGRIYCSEHGQQDAEGQFWCEECAGKNKLKLVKEVLTRVAFGKLSGVSGAKDE